MSAQNITPKYPVIGTDSSKLTAFFCEKTMTPPDEYYYYLIESEKKKRFEENEKRENSYGWGAKRDYSSNSEPDPKLDEATIRGFEFYKNYFEERAKKEGIIDFLIFLNLDEKQRKEHLNLLEQQRHEYDETLTLLRKTKATFTSDELEKVLAKAREHGIEERTLYDYDCWKKMVKIHKDFSTIDKIWKAVENLPEGDEKYRTLLVIYTHVYTLYINQSTDMMGEHSYRLYQEHHFKAFLHKCLLEGKFDEEGYNFQSITSSTWNNRPRQEYMNIVKARLLEKVEKISAERKVVQESNSNANLSNTPIQNPILYSQGSQQLQRVQGTSNQNSDQKMSSPISRAFTKS